MAEELDAERRAQVDAVVGRLRHVPGALLPILHAIQDELGFVPRGAVPLVAQGLNLSRAEVHGVLTFYHHFRAHPPGRHVVQICRAEACQGRGRRGPRVACATRTRLRLPRDHRFAVRYAHAAQVRLVAFARAGRLSRY